MLFKMLLALLPFFFFSDAGGTGDAGGDGDDAGNGDTDQKDKDQKGGDDDVAGLKSALANERKAARDAAKQLKTMQTELDTLKNAGKSEEDRREADLKAAQDKADAAETRLRDAVGRSAVLEAAQKSNASEPGAIFALIATDLDYDDDGAPTNVDEALDKAKTTYPKLFRAAGGTGDGGKGGATEPDVTPGLARMRRAYEKSEKTAKR